MLVIGVLGEGKEGYKTLVSDRGALKLTGLSRDGLKILVSMKR
jgi:hypothetical protein